MARNVARNPPPRQLNNKETLETLTHWETTFRTFYKRDDVYKYFFKPGISWDPSEQYYGLQDDNEGSNPRKKDELCEDLKDLLSTFAGYLPHSYLTEKILQSCSWAEVWQIVRDHYNVQVSSETMLDFEALQKTSEETYRQYFERLLQHTRQHLAPAEAKVENFKIEAKDKMTISLMNLVALQWLRKINPLLIDIVKIEYSTELRDNVQLADLVARIAPNIDSLLRRYEHGTTVNRVNTDYDDPDIHEAMVSKTFTRRNRNFVNNKSRGASNSNRGFTTKREVAMTNNRDMFCPACFYLSQQLNTPIHFKHAVGDCPRKAVTVKLLNMEDEVNFDVKDGDIIDPLGKSQCPLETKFEQPSLSFQTLNKRVNDLHDENNTNGEQVNIIVDTDIHQSPSANVLPTFSVVSDTRDNDSWTMKLQQLESRKAIWSSGGVRKANSPKLLVNLEGVRTYATVDEGSEINCIDESCAVKCRIIFEQTTCQAKAAGSSQMRLAGQTTNEVCVHICHDGSPIVLKLGKLIVVKNLGVDLLIREPAKIDNEIVTILHRRLVEVTNVKGARIKLPYNAREQEKKVFHCKSMCNEVVYPSASISIQLPYSLSSNKFVSITPKNNIKHNWIQPAIVPVDNDGNIKVVNSSDKPAVISKLEHFADVIPCYEVETDISLGNTMHSNKIYDLGMDNLNHFTAQKSDNCSYLNDISIDPDNVLSAKWKNTFASICEKFSHIITPRPGRYNGFFGRVDNSINFATKPPPSIKARLPKYSQECCE